MEDMPNAKALCSLLYGLVFCLKPETVLEVGTGFSTVAMARALRDSNTVGKVYSIEIKESRIGEVKALAEKEKVANYIEFVEGDSLKVLPGLLPRLGRIDLLFLDSGTKENYMQDFLLVERSGDEPTRVREKHLKPGSFVVAHDTNTYGGAMALEGFLKDRENYGVCSINKGPGIVIAVKL